MKTLEEIAEEAAMRQIQLRVSAKRKQEFKDAIVKELKRNKSGITIREVITRLENEAFTNTSASFKYARDLMKNLVKDGLLAEIYLVFYHADYKDLLKDFIETKLEELESQ